MEYTITIKQDMAYTYRVKAACLSEAIHRLSQIASEADVTGTPDGTRSPRRREPAIKQANCHRKIVVNPPIVRDRPRSMVEICHSMPD